MGQKISAYTPIERDLISTDLFDTSKDNGDASYSTRRVTADKLKTATENSFFHKDANIALGLHTIDVAYLKPSLTEITGVSPCIHDISTDKRYPSVNFNYYWDETFMYFEVTQELVDFCDANYTSWQFGFTINYK